MPEPGTYQTRISDYRDVDRLDGDATLAAYGELYGRVQRKLFAAFAAGRSVTSLKGEYLREYGIPARMFNAVRVSLEGKIASVREGMQGQRDELEGRVAQVERQVARAVKQGWRQVKPIMSKASLRWALWPLPYAATMPIPAYQADDQVSQARQHLRGEQLFL